MQKDFPWKIYYFMKRILGGRDRMAITVNEIISYYLMCILNSLGKVAKNESYSFNKTALRIMKVVSRIRNLRVRNSS